MNLYKRDGRRFVKVQDATGMFYQNNGTFQQKRDSNSIGICVLQTACIRKIVLFEEYIGNWDECKVFCASMNGHMPTRAEMYIASHFIRLGALPEGAYWTCEEYSSNVAWYAGFYLRNYFGRCGSYLKFNYYSVLAFVDINILKYGKQT